MFELTNYFKKFTFGSFDGSKLKAMQELGLPHFPTNLSILTLLSMSCNWNRNWLKSD